MALHLYRRHRVSCPHRARTWRRCACPIYATGTLGGTTVRLSLDQTDWDAATAVIAGWTRAGRVTSSDPSAQHTIEQAIADFQADQRTEGLQPETRRRHDRYLRFLQAWCDTNRYALLSDLTLDRVTAFRQRWPWAPNTKSVAQQGYGAFFNWCVARKRLEENPLTHMKPIKVPDTPTLPFTVDQVETILDACDHYDGTRIVTAARLKAFILLLRWTGLRLGDVANMAWDQLRDDGTVYLRMAKTGVPITLPVPPAVTSAFAALPRVWAKPFLDGGAEERHGVTTWGRAVVKVCAAAGVEDGHAHRFRDTFAVELLLAGVDLTTVSTLLGHSSVKVTERHYAPWVQSRQSRLADVVRASWGAAPPAWAPATADTPAATRTLTLASSTPGGPRRARA